MVLLLAVSALLVTPLAVPELLAGVIVLDETLAASAAAGLLLILAGSWMTGGGIPPRLAGMRRRGAAAAAADEEPALSRQPNSPGRGLPSSGEQTLEPGARRR